MECQIIKEEFLALRSHTKPIGSGFALQIGGNHVNNDKLALRFANLQKHFAKFLGSKVTSKDNQQKEKSAYKEEN